LVEKVGFVAKAPEPVAGYSTTAKTRVSSLSAGGRLDELFARSAVLDQDEIAG
jgi:hypothetical protein